MKRESTKGLHAGTNFAIGLTDDPQLPIMLSFKDPRIPFPMRTAWSEHEAEGMAYSLLKYIELSRRRKPQT